MSSDAQVNTFYENPHCAVINFNSHLIQLTKKPNQSKYVIRHVYNIHYSCAANQNGPTLLVE